MPQSDTNAGAPLRHRTSYTNALFLVAVGVPPSLVPTDGSMLVVCASYITGYPSWAFRVLDPVSPSACSAMRHPAFFHLPPPPRARTAADSVYNRVHPSDREHYYQQLGLAIANRRSSLRVRARVPALGRWQCATEEIESACARCGTQRPGAYAAVLHEGARCGRMRLYVRPGRRV